jgi:hypothetical protein
MVWCRVFIMKVHNRVFPSFDGKLISGKIGLTVNLHELLIVRQGYKRIVSGRSHSSS